MGGYPQHLADVTARVVEAWLGEKADRIDEAVWDWEDERDRPSSAWVLAALAAGIGERQ